jgi:hypothetical protein
MRDRIADTEFGWAGAAAPALAAPFLAGFIKAPVKESVDPLARHARPCPGQPVRDRNRAQQGSRKDSVTAGRYESGEYQGGEAKSITLGVDNDRSNDVCDVDDPNCRRKPDAASAGRSHFSLSEAPSPDR